MDLVTSGLTSISFSTRFLSAFSQYTRYCVIVSAGLAGGATRISTGSCNNSFANSLISFGIVAENITVWRTSGIRLAIVRTSPIKPISNIRSASSSTNISISLKTISPWTIKSFKRPGVAIKISQPLRSAFLCGPDGAPPYTQQARSFKYLPNFLKFSKIWTASSRVGVNTNARIWCFFLYSSLFKIGNAKAAVLPVPVWAQAMISFPSNMTGIAFSWIGDGVSYFALLTALSIGSLSSKSEKFINLLCFLVSSKKNWSSFCIPDQYNQFSIKDS